MKKRLRLMKSWAAENPLKPRKVNRGIKEGKCTNTGEDVSSMRKQILILKRELKGKEESLTKVNIAYRPDQRGFEKERNRLEERTATLYKTLDEIGVAKAREAKEARKELEHGIDEEKENEIVTRGA